MILQTLFRLEALHSVKFSKDLVTGVRDESMDYDGSQHEEPNTDNISNSYSISGLFFSSKLNLNFSLLLFR